jgi:hypothetical protein
MKNFSMTAFCAVSLIFIFTIITNAETFIIPVPQADGTAVHRTHKAEIDYSNASDGYIMVRFLENDISAVRVLIAHPDNTIYQYHLTAPDKWDVFPLSGGNGRYIIGVFEQVTGNKYTSVAGVNFIAVLSDGFSPFLRPNQFVNFSENSKVVAKAAEIVYNSSSVIESVERIYNFVIENIEYDFELAETVQSGYVPDVDLVLERGKGICFDYAALMTAMLRSRGIPTKLVIGYVGELRHAWISVYSEEIGWIDNIIQYEGIDWRLLDPTFAASSNQCDDESYIATHFH